MLDLKLLRKDPSHIEKKLKNKIPDLSLSEILILDEKLRALKTELDQCKSEQNEAAKKIGEAKRKGEDSSSILKEMGALKEKIHLISEQYKEQEIHLHTLLSSLPNIPLDEIPISLSAEDNVCIKTFKEKPTFSFPIKNHVELNEKLNLFDFKRAAKISGSSWPLYVGMGAELEWALLNYMLDIHKKNGFTQVIPPLLVKPDVMHGSGQLPKFESQLFQIHDPDYHLYLIPTAEAPLNGMHIDEIIDESLLPLKYCSYTPCFRREAGAAGSQERGLIRMHQFNKVEMFCLSEPEKSEEIFEMMIKSAEEVLEGLDLHYRNMLLTTGDMSFAAAKTVDIEVWLPGQDRYYEVSSVSNCTDFQARRSNTRSKKEGEKPHFIHTLNGSGLATSRLMVALLENNQQEDGSVLVPKALAKYLKEEVSHIKAES